eukprot:CAMPEP_0197540414 /NCGR_PEP_ID=MMETSP1318-20131121/65726_1 /TAXON_ID=552666 /ORGANISM="Partenskyella glossopodia, Strain RCC365" /LENGTH=234 /DNA_ID=CAMNT_0043099397 /DNA_START=72 /DNA_END=776 /DNA_ORIENTATION=+
MPPPTDKQLSEAVGVFLEDADFETVTSKGIRKALEAKYGMKLRDRKDFIQEAALAAMKRIEREREEGSDSSDEDAPIASIGYKKHAKKKSSKAEVTTFEENGVFYSRTGRPQRSGAAKRQIRQQIRKSRKRPADANGTKGNGSDKKKKKKNGFSKKLAITSEGLRNFLGTDMVPRFEAVSKIWSYCKDHDLKDQKDGRQMLLDETLKEIFNVKKFTYFSLNKYLSKYLKDPDLC